jgi:hypothetical protein
LEKESFFVVPFGFFIKVGEGGGAEKYRKLKITVL